MRELIRLHDVPDRTSQFISITGTTGSRVRKFHAHTLFIANGRNFVREPSGPPGSTPEKFTNVGSLIGGGIEAISDDLLERLRTHMISFAQQVYGTKPTRLSRARKRLSGIFLARTIHRIRFTTSFTLSRRIGPTTKSWEM